MKRVIISSTIADMEKDIKKSKNKLKKKPLVENFGQDEVRRISDKYFDLQIENYQQYSSLIREFSDWCANYEGDNIRSSVHSSEDIHKG